MAAIRPFFPAAAGCLSLAGAAFAQDHPVSLHVHDVYARLSAMSGAVFFTIHNNGLADDRLIGARTVVARKAELHTSMEDANGVVSMVRLVDGVALPSGEMHAFERGGDHLMLMGLTGAVTEDNLIPLTLIFESGTEVALTAPVDNARKDNTGMMHGHSGHTMPGAAATD